MDIPNATRHSPAGQQSRRILNRAGAGVRIKYVRAIFQTAEQNGNPRCVRDAKTTATTTTTVRLESFRFHPIPCFVCSIYRVYTKVYRTRTTSDGGSGRYGPAYSQRARAHKSTAHTTRMACTNGSRVDGVHEHSIARSVFQPVNTQRNGIRTGGVVCFVCKCFLVRRRVYLCASCGRDTRVDL